MASPLSNYHLRLFRGLDSLFDELEGALGIVVQTDRETDEAFAHAHLFLNVFRNLRGGGLARVAEQSLEVAEAHCEVAHAQTLHLFHDGAGSLSRTHVNGDHTAKAVFLVHHGFEQLVIHMLGKTGIVVFDTSFFESLGQIHSILAVFFHADVQGVQILLDAG